MEETGVVLSTQGRLARVLVKRKEGICDKCTAGTCHLSDRGAELEALNLVDARPGQQVKVVLQPYTYVKGSLIIYGLPVLGLILGAVLGKELLAPKLSGMDADLVSAFTGFSAFLLLFLAARLWGRRAERKLQYKPVIQEILG
jgi:sigma-E factor negative regulatory protein RseC